VRVAHIVNSFDPACDVLRCVMELNKYSQHSHWLYVKEPHPAQAVYQYEQQKPPSWLMPSQEINRLIDESDVLIHHFAGWENGWGHPDKPSAFRNINIYHNKETDRFWSVPEYNAASYDRYKLVASSHVGAIDFMPVDRFRWLPDLLPLDGPYTFYPAKRPRPAVSFIKHAAELWRHDMRGVHHLDCSNMAHADVLRKRQSFASVVIDNVCDGHYGLAGQEAVILGLPVVVFNHEKTLATIGDWEKTDTIFPFIQATTVDEAADIAAAYAKKSETSQRIHRQMTRNWAEEFFEPQLLISSYWDPFIKELAS
jgi:hypothetical protein